MDICKCIMIGRITKDCEVTMTNDGTYVTKLDIAVNEYQKDKVSYFHLVKFDKQNSNLSNYLNKGQQISVECRPRQERWQDKTTGNNRERFVFIVDRLQLLGGSNNQHNNNTQYNNNNNQMNESYFNDPWGEM